MIGPLLETKVTVPPARDNPVIRERLHKKLDTFRQGNAPLLLISAKAGAGKSSLVTQWLHSSDLEAAWLSLDPNDNDPGRFLRYTISALKLAGFVEHLDLSAAFDSLTSPDPSATAALLLEKLSHSELHSMLVLDDFHVIDDQWVHTFTESLIEGFGQSGSLMVITRSDPPMPLARWRGRGQMVEIRDLDLRFYPDEIEQYFKQVMQFDLSSSQLSTLDDRTEGWIVGLQMAAITMKDWIHKGRLDEFIQGFRGTNRYILDYLMDEVLGQQPAFIQDFLLETSILDRFSADLCDAVFAGTGWKTMVEDPPRTEPGPGIPDSREILGQLEQANMFLVPLDDDRQWFRYHHLFADLLQNELKQQRSQADIRRIHVRASNWFQANRLIDEALEHTFAAQDYDLAADIIEENIVRILSQSTMPQVLTWIEMLPEELIQCRPWIAIYWANTLVFAGQVDGVEELLANVEERSSEQRDADALIGYAAAIRAYLANLRGDPEQTFEMAALSQANIPDGYINARSMASYALADAHIAMDNLPQAEAALQELLHMGTRSGQLIMIVTALCELASVRKMQGHLRAAEQYLAQTWDQLFEHNGLDTRLRCHYEFGMADLLYEWNRLDEAYEHAKIGMALRDRLGGYYVTGDIPMMRILQARGQSNDALNVLRDVERVVSSAHVQLSGTIALRAASVIEYIAVGDLDQARLYVERCVGETDLEVLARARFLLAKDRFQEVLDLVDAQVRNAKTDGRTARMIQLLCHQALAFEGLDEHERACRLTTEAIAAGRPEHFIRSFLDIHPKLAQLIRRSIKPYQDESVEVSPIDHLNLEYALDLLSAFAQDQDVHERAMSAMARQTRAEGYIDPLTERELEVLALLADGLSNKELAARLVVAPSTIKQHLKNIYAKLDVHNRTEAVTRAREFNLLI